MSYLDRAVWSVDDDELQEYALKELFAMRDELALLRQIAKDHGVDVEVQLNVNLTNKALHDFTEALTEPEPPLSEQVEREIATDLQWLTDSAYGQADLEAKVNEA